MREECGIFGIYPKDLKVNIAQLTYLGLLALQHRGQESAGIAVNSGKNILIYRDLGLVTEVFKKDILKTLHGDVAIGHVRYSGSSINSWENSQPILQQFAGGTFALAFNGNLVNRSELCSILDKCGKRFDGSLTDSRLICSLIEATGEKDLEKAIQKVAKQIKGAFCLVLLSEDRLIGLRDGLGFHPLVLGEIGDGFVLASEDSAFSIIEAQYIREVQPGEIIIIERNDFKA